MISACVATHGKATRGGKPRRLCRQHADKQRATLANNAQHKANNAQHKANNTQHKANNAQHAAREQRTAQRRTTRNAGCPPEGEGGPVEPKVDVGLVAGNTLLVVPAGRLEVQVDLGLQRIPLQRVGVVDRRRDVDLVRLPQ